MKLGLTIFGYTCVFFAVVFGAVSIRYLTLGAPDAAQPFMGLAITILSLAFMEFDVIRHWERFTIFQVLFIAGISLVTPFIQSGTPFSTTTSMSLAYAAIILCGLLGAGIGPKPDRANTGHRADSHLRSQLSRRPRWRRQHEPLRNLERGRQRRTLERRTR